MEIIKALVPRLICVDCRSDRLDYMDGKVFCSKCQRTYQVHNERIISMLPSNQRSLPDVYSDPDYIRYQEMWDNDPKSVYRSESSWIHYKTMRSSLDNIGKFVQENVISDSNTLVLDLGCGTGGHFPGFVPPSRVIGSDISLGSLYIAAERHPDAFFIQADATALPFYNGIFDVIVSNHTMEHIWYLNECFSECHRILVDNGRFYVGLPTEGGFLWTWGRRLTTERLYRRKFGIDYGRVARIDHCNTAPKVISHGQESFTLRKLRYWPFRIPLLSINLTVTAEFQKVQAV